MADGDGKGATAEQQKKEATRPQVDKDAEQRRLDALGDRSRGEGVAVGTKPEKEQPPPDPARALARRAVEIAEAQGSKLGSAITGPQAALIKERLGSKPNDKFAPATLQQLQEYAQGGRSRGRDDLPGEALQKLRDFCKATESRRIWPRKVAAMVLALDEQTTGRARPNTRPKPEQRDGKGSEADGKAPEDGKSAS